MASNIASDLQQLASQAWINNDSDTLINCGNSLWTDIILGIEWSSSRQELDEAIVSKKEEIIKACLELAKKLESGSGSSSIAGVFSGFTGFDSLPSFCGAESISSQSTMEDELVDIVNSLLSNCSANPEISGNTNPETLMDLTVEGAPKPEDAEGPGPAEDASVTSEETTYQQDSNGNTTSVTTVTTYSDGTQTTTTTDVASGDTTSTTHYADGSVGSIHSSSDGTVDKSYTDASSGNTTTSHTNADGFTKVDGPDDQSAVYDSSGKLRGYHDKNRWMVVDENGMVYGIVTTPDKRKEIGPIDCLDESCYYTCQDAGIFVSELIEDCLMTGGLSNQCQAYQRAFGCCDNFSQIRPLVLPNPNGDLVCTGMTEVDIKVKACEERCSVAAEQNDCNSSCQSSIPPIIYNVLDEYCIYAYSEECVFQNEGSSSPRPSTNVLNDSFLFPWP